MVIKMKDLIKAQGNMFRKKHMWTEAPDDEKKSPPTGGQEPPESKKLKIDIPSSPFEPDINQVKDQLKHILKKWEVQQYPSDEIRWKLYYKDIAKLVKQIEGESDEV
tara:strand:- start:349 stop:669 length:321 start_codon:yes stop_codon:yes gene_type:complete